MATYPKDEMFNLMRDREEFRERTNKCRALAFLIKQKYNVDIDARVLADSLHDALLWDRSFRAALEDYPELRGEDYGKKLPPYEYESTQKKLI